MTARDNPDSALPFRLSRELSEARTLGEVVEVAFRSLNEPFDASLVSIATIPRHSLTYQAYQGVAHPFEPDMGVFERGEADPRIVPIVFGHLFSQPAGSVTSWRECFNEDDELHVHAREVVQKSVPAHASISITLGNDAEHYAHFAVYRDTGDFDGSRNALLKRLGPVVRTVTRSLILRETAELVLAGAAEIAALQDRLLLILNEHLGVEWASPQYRERLAPFVGPFTGELSPKLSSWLRETTFTDGTLARESGPWEMVIRRDRGAARFRACVTRTPSGRAGLLLDVTLRDPAEQRERLRSLGLTPRQVDIVGLIPRGLTNQQIAHALGIREVTVKKHLRSIGDKLGVRGKVDILQRLAEILNHPDWPDPQGI